MVPGHVAIFDYDRSVQMIFLDVLHAVIKSWNTKQRDDDFKARNHFIHSAS